MAEKQKPIPAIVKKAARLMKHPEDATKADIKSMAARLLDDQKNDPRAHNIEADGWLWRALKLRDCH
jgi:hypothetical protein